MSYIPKIDQGGAQTSKIDNMRFFTIHRDFSIKAEKVSSLFFHPFSLKSNNPHIITA
jgi:hypothetical protein